MYTIMMKQGKSGNREQWGRKRTRERTSEEQEREFFLSLEKNKTLSLSFKIEIQGNLLNDSVLFAKFRLYEIEEFFFEENSFYSLKMAARKVVVL